MLGAMRFGVVSSCYRDLRLDTVKPRAQSAARAAPIGDEF